MDVRGGWSLFSRTSPPPPPRLCRSDRHMPLSPSFPTSFSPPDAPPHDAAQYVDVHASWKLHKVGPSMARADALPSTDFSAKMQRARVGARLTLQQLGQLCFVSAAQLATYERGEDAPSESTMDFIVKVCEDHKAAAAARGAGGGGGGSSRP